MEVADGRVYGRDAGGSCGWNIPSQIGWEVDGLRRLPDFDKLFTWSMLVIGLEDRGRCEQGCIKIAVVEDRRGTFPDKTNDFRDLKMDIVGSVGTPFLGRRRNCDHVLGSPVLRWICIFFARTPVLPLAFLWRALESVGCGAGSTGDEVGTRGCTVGGA